MLFPVMLLLLLLLLYEPDKHGSKKKNNSIASTRSASCRPLIASIFRSARLVSLLCKPHPFSPTHVLTAYKVCTTTV